MARIYPERSYGMAVKAKQKYPGGMYLSADSPSRSIRVQRAGKEELYIIGGENHKTGQGLEMIEHFKALNRFTEGLLGEYEIPYRWSAQDYTSMDKMPYIGQMTKDEPNILVATGYRKWGMTNGTVAAQLMTDIVLGETTQYEELFAPQRFKANPSIRKAVSENFNVAKELIKGKLDRSDSDLGELSYDEATTIRRDGERIGAYRDEKGNLHIVDTTCTHVGCECHWNNAERTWDCPCHGSRFSYTGDVIEGPAEKPLKKHPHDLFDQLDKKEPGY